MEKETTEKRELTFFEVVLAVLFGLMIFDWIKDLQTDQATMQWLSPLLLIGFVSYIVGGVAVEQWQQHRRNKKYDEEQANEKSEN